MAERFIRSLQKGIATRVYRRIVRDAYQSTVNEAAELGRKGEKGLVVTIVEADGVVKTKVSHISPPETEKTPELTVGESFDINFGANQQRRRIQESEQD